MILYDSKISGKYNDLKIGRDDGYQGVGRHEKVSDMLHFL